MGRIHVVVDGELIEACMKATGIKTPTGVVVLALRELLRRRKQRGLLNLKGRVEWEGDLEAWRNGSPRPI